MDKVITETRLVSGFDRIAVRGNTCVQLFIKQGEKEELTIQAPREYLESLDSEVREGILTLRLNRSWLEELKTVLSNIMYKPQIIYNLVLRELTYLEVQCAYSAHLGRIETPNLKIKLNGIGGLKIDWLSTKALEVQHYGSGVMQIAGYADEQTIMLEGIGSYQAANLESQRARVRISGPGIARVHASQEIDAMLRGIGSLEYSGKAKIRKRISGPGQVRFLG